MKRGEPPQRKTPLSQGDKPLKQGDKPLRRSRMREGHGPARKPPKPRQAAPSTGPGVETRALVSARSGGMCERCHMAPAAQQHHRCGRQMGGSRNTPWINAPSSIVDLCGTSADGCHGWATTRPEEAEPTGWVVPRGIAEQHGGMSGIRVIDTSGRAWLLDDTGGKTQMCIFVSASSDDGYCACVKPVHAPTDYHACTHGILA